MYTYVSNLMPCRSRRGSRKKILRLLILRLHVSRPVKERVGSVGTWRMKARESTLVCPIHTFDIFASPCHFLSPSLALLLCQPLSLFSFASHTQSKPPLRTRKDTILIVRFGTNGARQKIGSLVVGFDLLLECCRGEAGDDLGGGGEGGSLPCL